MALLKQVTTPQGVVTDYHRINRVEVSSERKVVEIWVSLYASAEARDAGRQPVWNEYVTIPFDALSQDPRGTFYPMLADFWGSYLKDATADIMSGDEPPRVFGVVEAAKTEPPPPPPPVEEVIPPVEMAPHPEMSEEERTMLAPTRHHGPPETLPAPARPTAPPAVGRN